MEKCKCDQQNMMITLLEWRDDATTAEKTRAFESFCGPPAGLDAKPVLAPYSNVLQRYAPSTMQHSRQRNKEPYRPRTRSKTPAFLQTT